jgi:hypothetical protein
MAFFFPPPPHLESSEFYFPNSMYLQTFNKTAPKDIFSAPYKCILKTMLTVRKIIRSLCTDQVTKTNFNDSGYESNYKISRKKHKQNKGANNVSKIPSVLLDGEMLVCNVQIHLA